jgi:hypothetical protein
MSGMIQESIRRTEAKALGDFPLLPRVDATDDDGMGKHRHLWWPYAIRSHDVNQQGEVEVVWECQARECPDRQVNSQGDVIYLKSITTAPAPTGTVP